MVESTASGRCNHPILMNDNDSAQRASVVLADLAHAHHRLCAVSVPHNTPTKQKTRQDQLAWRAVMMSSLMPGFSFMRLSDHRCAWTSTPRPFVLDTAPIIPSFSPKRKWAFSALGRNAATAVSASLRKSCDFRHQLPRRVRLFRTEVSRGTGPGGWRANGIRSAARSGAAARTWPAIAKAARSSA